jgi:Ca-activated chloride channel family protein
MLKQGTSPDPATIDPQTFLNYYRTRYPDPAADKIGVYPQLDQGALPSEWILQVGVQTAPAPVPRHAKSVITVVVDSSVSMAIGGDTGGMARAKAAVKAIADALYAGDTLNVITTAPGAKPTTLSISGPADQGVKGELDRLAVDGGEDVNGAIAQAYQTANDTRVAGGLNRVVLITDGVIPDGAIDTTIIADRLDKQGIGFVSVGVGPAATSGDARLAEAARAGGGSNLYLDDPGAADELLHLRFDEIMDVALSDLRVTITIPGAFTVLDQPDEQIAADSASVAGPTIGPGRSVVFRQHLRSCDPFIQGYIAALPIQIDVEGALPGTAVASLASLPMPVSKLLGADPFPVRKVSAILGYGAALRSLDQKRIVDAHTAITTLLSPMGTSPDPELDAIRLLIESDKLYQTAP